LTHTGLQTKDSHCQLKGRNPNKTIAKLDEIMANKQRNLLYFHSRVEKVVRFLEVDDCGDER
jgi:hypothetical protein